MFPIAVRNQMKLSELYQKARELEDSAAKVALFERLIEQADQDGAASFQIAARLDYIKAANKMSQQERGIMATAWLVRHLDRFPEDFNHRQTTRTLHRLKWACTSAPWYPNVPRARIDQLLADYAARVGPDEERSLAYMQASIFGELGELEAMERERVRFERLPRGEFSDCEACERTCSISLLLKSDRFQDAIDHAAPILDGTLSCEHVPAGTIGLLLEAWHAVGDLDTAETMLKRLLKLKAGRFTWVWGNGEILEHYAATDNQRDGIPFLEKTLAKSAASHDVIGRLRFGRGAVRLLERVAPERVLRLTRIADLDMEDMSAGELLAKLREESAGFAAALDARNGNGFYTAFLAKGRVRQ